MNPWTFKPLAQVTVLGFEPQSGFEACALLLYSLVIGDDLGRGQ